MVVSSAGCPVDDNAILAVAWMQAYTARFPIALEQDRNGLLPHNLSPADASALFADASIAALNERMQAVGGMAGYLRLAQI